MYINSAFDLIIDHVIVAVIDAFSIGTSFQRTHNILNIRNICDNFQWPTGFSLQ
jgi:hypothetical protein